LRRYRKYLEFLALAFLAALIIWLFGRRLNWAEVRNALRQSDWGWIAAAALFVCAGYLWRALRWRELLRPLTPSSVRELFVATTVGFTAIFLVGRAGEVVRPVVLPMRDHRVRPSASFVTIMVERIYDSMTVVFIFALNLLWFRSLGGSASELARVRAIGLALVAAGVLVLAALVWFRRRSGRIIGWLDGLMSGFHLLPERLKHAILSLLDQLARALSVLSDVRQLAVTIGWTVLLWASIAAANLLVFRAFGLPFGITHAVFVLGWSMIGSVVPTPGGAAGAFHAATGAGLVFLGVVPEQAAAISIVLHLIDFGPAVLFGVFYFLRGEINFGRLRALTSPAAVEHAVEDEKIRPQGAITPKDLETAALSK
jgi:glycosyltransferase 2 family protein